jgi:hypothetical protein
MENVVYWRFTAFVDSTKAFGRVYQNILLNVVEEKGFPRHLLNVVESLFVCATIQTECVQN